VGEAIRDKIEAPEMSLWHGQVDKALGKMTTWSARLAPFSETYARFPKLVKACRHCARILSTTGP